MTAQPSGRTFASVDLGSHTVRLLIAEMERDGVISPLVTERRITRLAAGFGPDEALKQEGMRRSIEAVAEYAEILNGYGVSSVSCGATGVVRRASNRQSFLEDIRRNTGIRPRVLSEDEEAALSAKGTLSVLPSREGLVLSFDLGGSSTEFLLADCSRPESPLFSTSVFIGAATISERFLREDPPHKGAVSASAAYAGECLLPVISSVKPLLPGPGNPDRFQLVGTAGTVTTLAAMHMGMECYEPWRVNGHILPQPWLFRTVELLERTPLAERRRIKGLEKGREDIILGGAIIVSEIVKAFRPDRLVAVDGGLLEGLLLDLVEKEHGMGPSLLSPLTWHMQTG